MNDDLGPTVLGARIDRTNELLQRMLAEVAKTPSTHAIFVDAGYLYAAAGRLVAGTEDRRAFDLDAEGLIEALIDRARTIFADSRLLRVYWYDGARRRIHTAEQQSIAELPDVKVRLGNLNANNQQKGVDSLIRTDLESLARHRAISDAALVGGDEDLVSAVEAAQGYGARVHLWGIEAAEGRNQAEPLLWEVDSQRTFDLDFFKPYVTRRAAAMYDTTARAARARGRPLRRRADRREVALLARPRRPRRPAARAPLPARLRRPGPARRGGGAPPVLAARPGASAKGTAGRLLGAPPGAVLARHRCRPNWGRPVQGCGELRDQPRTTRSRRTHRQSVSPSIPERGERLGRLPRPVRVGGVLGARDRPCGGRRAVRPSRRGAAPATCRRVRPTGRGRGAPTAASSATRSGSSHNCRPAAMSWAGLLPSQRRLRSSWSSRPRPGRPRRPPAAQGPDGFPHLTHVHHGERVPQELHALLLGGGDLGGPRRHQGERAETGRVSSTAARATWPPKEWPDEVDGSCEPSVGAST